ncbi:hypothetical protein DVH24_009500 [Malus domestica]|uniref:S-protein homolog n=1 Tax=Malus domestica TaxID=3750 RepID=A0A498IR38_MALDO|nr:hypothetical protein DVH24_009500 [Malus domestica]
MGVTEQCDQPSKHSCAYEKRSGSHIYSDAKNYMLREIVNPVTHGTMINYLRNGRNLTVHCKSKDDSVDVHVHVITLMGKADLTDKPKCVKYCEWLITPNGACSRLVEGRPELVDECYP